MAKKYDGASVKGNGYVNDVENHPEVPKMVQKGSGLKQIGGYIAEKVFPNKTMIMPSKEHKMIVELEEEERRR